MGVDIQEASVTGPSGESSKIAVFWPKSARKYLVYRSSFIDSDSYAHMSWVEAALHGRALQDGGCSGRQFRSRKQRAEKPNRAHVS